MLRCLTAHVGAVNTWKETKTREVWYYLRALFSYSLLQSSTDVWVHTIQQLLYIKANTYTAHTHTHRERERSYIAKQKRKKKSDPDAS